MNRDIRKLVNEYEQKFGNNGTAAGNIYSCDMMQVADIAMEHHGDELYTAIYYALEAGYMLGYKKGRKDERSKRKPIAQ